MACYHPVPAFQTSDGEVLFSERRGHDFVRSLQLPCGQCIGCRLERSRQWAVRCVHEAQVYDENCFLTLTYDDAHLPPLGSLRYADWRLFFRRLRRAHRGQVIRFYMCGEYGSRTQRPHYHACVFNYGFPDRTFYSKARDGHSLYRSRELDELWPHGLAVVGSLTFESAAYVARYITTKVTGDLADAHYQGRVPEFNRMSLRPGIGAPWLARYRSDVYPSGEVVSRGHKARAPRYYDKLFSGVDPDAFERLCFDRQLDGRDRAWDNTDERLKVREEVALARLNLGSRE